MTHDQSPYTGRPIIDWADERYLLRDVNGDKIGEIVEINPDFVVVETSGGFLGFGERRTYYVPRTAVAQDQGADWYLSVDKDQLEEMGWSSPPTTSSTFATDQWRTGPEMTAAATSYQGETESQPTRLIRYEEDLQAQTVTRQAGEVAVRKEVVEEVRTVEVPVRREEVHIERRPVSEGGSMEDAFVEGEIRVPVMEEDVEVRKVVRPVEEVVVSKSQTQDTRTVSDTVRREEFETEGDVVDVEAEVGTRRSGR